MAYGHNQEPHCQPPLAAASRVLSLETWKERNKHIFRNESKPPEMTWASIIKALQETILSQPWTDEDWKTNQYESIILRELAISTTYALVGMTQVAPKVSTPSEWSPPPQGFIKLNFDGASKGNPGRLVWEGFSEMRKGRSSKPMQEN
jgi:hypothetical protein